MSDDRDFNASKENIKETRIAMDKIRLKEVALDFEEIKELKLWKLTLNTKYGLTEVYYCPDTTKWKKIKGLSKGKGIQSMLKYFKPITY